MLLHEIVVSRDGERISMVLHWQGGDHTSLEFLKSKTGEHRYATPANVVTLVRELARVQPDQGIVAILNRIGMLTGHGNTWTEGRLRVFRRDHDIPVYEEGEREARGELTLEETAAVLRCRGAPWIIQRAEAERLAKENGPRTKDTAPGHLSRQCHCRKHRRR